MDTVTAVVGGKLKSYGFFVIRTVSVCYSIKKCFQTIKERQDMQLMTTLYSYRQSAHK